VKLEETVPAVLRFFVRDTGVGFPQEKADQMFESFRQLDMSKTRPFEGSGLGLAISTQLARMLGGELEARGEEDVGATFTFSLPIGSLTTRQRVPTGRRIIPSTPSPMSRARLKGHILVVDDNPDVRRLITESLRAAGADVIGLETGVAALERVRDDDDLKHPFDAIIMDVHMPGLDGLETTRVLRRRGYDGAIIAVTARAMSSDREECLEAGCTDYLTKPVDLGTLQRVLSNYVATSEDDSSESGQSASSRVLVVDDNRDAAELVGEVLEAGGLEVAVETDVAGAVDRWQSFGATTLVTDINFDGSPKGLDLAKEIRTKHPHATLIAVSGAADMEPAAERAGFDHFLLKPFPLDDLRQLIPTVPPSSASPSPEGNIRAQGGDEEATA
jgi:CheY-like chemotaxis protein